MPIKKLKIGFIKNNSIQDLLPEDINTVIIQIDTYNIMRQYIKFFENDSIDDQIDNITIDIYNYINKNIKSISNIDTLIIISPNIVWYYINKLYGISITKLVENVFSYYVQKMGYKNYILTNLDNHNNILVDDDVYLSNMGALFVGTRYDIGIKNEYMWCFSNYINDKNENKILIHLCYYNDVVLNSLFRCLPYHSISHMYFTQGGYANFKHLFSYLKFHLMQNYKGTKPDVNMEEVGENVFYNIIIRERILNI